MKSDFLALFKGCVFRFEFILLRHFSSVSYKWVLMAIHVNSSGSLTFTYIKITCLWQKPRQETISSWIIQQYIPQTHHADHESLKFSKKVAPKPRISSAMWCLCLTQQEQIFSKSTCVCFCVQVWREATMLILIQKLTPYKFQSQMHAAE